MAAEKGLSDFDHRHRFVTSFLYELPFLKRFGRLDPHRVCRLAGGGHLDTAKWITLYRESLDRQRQQRTPIPSQRPNLVCNPNDGPKTTAQWFNTSCFVTAGSVCLWHGGP